ncbi:hypothetical protein FISHEDRAFT_74420 [Fistulina hepatica ATCC 64428]|uniref:Uncharacterized protein n=1 Tax=Fistulina hepatica ATCC 64428 TaxID=1128425 RepID=A0A0D7AB27_9AGAR|nr:hypothetical protein FISHEDRAFT_74420 [Fistulina hepatica ATCC 64428]
MDALGQLIIMWSLIADWMKQLMPQINEDHAAFVVDLMGHDRNNKLLALTGWHKSDEGAINKLMSKCTFKRYNGMANALLEIYFLRIA